MKSALVIGGTGPTGPHTVDGLIDRGHDVTILHSGQHEVEFKQEIEHIHADVHFREPFEAAIGNRKWDVVVAGYGRLKLAVEVLKGHTGRVVAMGGGPLASREDPRWGPLGPASNLDEERGLQEIDPARNKLAYQMAKAEEALFAAHHEGDFNATLICFPILYGPRQPGATDWCIVKRALDKRQKFIVADGGIKVEARAFAQNAAHAVLLAIDRSDVAAGKKYLVADDLLYTMRQRIEGIARIMGHEFELVDMPWDLAVPCHVLWRRSRGNYVRDTSRIRRELGYAAVVDPYSALQRSVEWLLANCGGIAELEEQLGDPFDYAREDALVRQWESVRAQAPDVDYPLPTRAHIYRHPSKPGESWQRPAAASSPWSKT